MKNCVSGKVFSNANEGFCDILNEFPVVVSVISSFQHEFNIMQIYFVLTLLCLWIE